MDWESAILGIHKGSSRAAHPSKPLVYISKAPNFCFTRSLPARLETEAKALTGKEHQKAAWRFPVAKMWQKHCIGAFQRPSNIKHETLLHVSAEICMESPVANVLRYGMIWPLLQSWEYQMCKKLQHHLFGSLGRSTCISLYPKFNVPFHWNSLAYLVH